MSRIRAGCGVSLEVYPALESLGSVVVENDCQVCDNVDVFSKSRTSDEYSAGIELRESFMIGQKRFVKVWGKNDVRSRFRTCDLL